MHIFSPLKSIKSFGIPKDSSGKSFGGCRAEPCRFQGRTLGPVASAKKTPPPHSVETVPQVGLYKIIYWDTAASRDVRIRIICYIPLGIKLFFLGCRVEPSDFVLLRTDCYFAKSTARDSRMRLILI